MTSDGTMTERQRRSSSITVEEHYKGPTGAVRKVCGQVTAVGHMDHEAKAFEKEIRTKNVVQLQEVLARQNKILENKTLLQKLPDKGAKVKQRKEMIENLIETRMRSLNEAADLLSALSLGGPSRNGGKIDCDEMEWKFGGGHLFRKLDPSSVTQPLDSDDDENEENGNEDSTNPLKVLATKELPTVRKTTSKRISEMSDDVKSVNEELCSETPYAEHLFTKVDETESKARTRFAPFKSVELKSEKCKSKPSNPPTGKLVQTSRPDRPIKTRQIEVMPLPSVKYTVSTVQMVSLKDSLELERAQAEKLKEIQLKHAMERLGALAGSIKMKDIQLSAQEKMAYRDTHDSSDFNADEVENEEEEEHDGIAIRFSGTEIDDDDKDDRGEDYS